MAHCHMELMSLQYIRLHLSSEVQRVWGLLRDRLAEREEEERKRRSAGDRSKSGQSHEVGLVGPLVQPTEGHEVTQTSSKDSNA